MPGDGAVDPDPPALGEEHVAALRQVKVVRVARAASAREDQGGGAAIVLPADQTDVLAAAVLARGLLVEQPAATTARGR